MQSTYDLSNLVPTTLAKFFNLAGDRGQKTSADFLEHEYASIFEQLLKSPLLIIKTDGDAIPTHLPDDQWCSILFADALFTETPDRQILELIKQFAKREHLDSDSYLPRPVALLLYYLTLAVAENRLRDRVTTLSDHDLAAGLDWALRQKWIDHVTHSVFQRVRQQMDV